MIEWILCWIFLIKGIDANDVMYFIASGLFAIATNISQYRYKRFGQD